MESQVCAKRCCFLVELPFCLSILVYRMTINILLHKTVCQAIFHSGTGIHKTWYSQAPLLHGCILKNRPHFLPEPVASRFPDGLHHPRQDERKHLPVRSGLCSPLHCLNHRKPYEVFHPLEVPLNGWTPDAPVQKTSAPFSKKQFRQITSNKTSSSCYDYSHSISP